MGGIFISTPLKTNLSIFLPEKLFCAIWALLSSSPFYGTPQLSFLNRSLNSKIPPVIHMSVDIYQDFEARKRS